ncbi:transglycosylase SLT domain-containing protein [Reinekea blandensis]|uniref:transglycosylase SLT domain-containing protein n=1 Tax=Reinekea blandensis TaxID=374838 RepID=UPI0013757AD3|nr:transglycosylase SLT domain-containing protein [Reinekea blandensis]
MQSWNTELLYPYLQEAWLTRNLDEITIDQANAFMQTPENRAAAWFFKSLWYEELIRREAWPEIINTLSDTSNPALKCHYFKALEETGQPVPDIEVMNLWMSGQSRPDHCDPFFNDWITRIDDPDPIIWERQLLAFYDRNGKLIRYLNRFYQSPENRKIGEFLNRVYQQPKEIISQAYNPESDKMHQLALAAVNRMAFQDPRSASNLWQAIVRATPEMSPNDIRKASRYLGIAMAKQALPEASYWLTIADARRDDEEVQHWRLQIALSRQDYAAVISIYNELDSSLKQSDQWRYWAGVARAVTEKQVAADNPLIPLSQQRLYYGFLAAGVLNTEPTLGTQREYPSNNLVVLSAEPALQRAQALFEMGDITRAQVEWNLFVRTLDNASQHAAAELALSWGWYAKSSQAAGWSRRYDLIDLRYPDAYASEVDAMSQLLELPKHWVYGVMRQESRFDHQAVSPAGALGLMQVMPATARQTAQKYGLLYRDQSDLHLPTINIAIGTHYLNELMTRFNHPVLATAAYNAGPSRVNLWRERFPEDITVWIESIPFNETRNYVKAVMAYSQIYALQHGMNWHLSAWTEPALQLARASD